MALVLGWNWPGVERNGRDDLPSSASMCLSGLVVLVASSKQALNFLKGNDAHFTDLH